MKNIFRDYDKMNATEIKILQYIIKNTDEIQKITVKELSQRLFVSKTTVINLAKKLGYEGYSELRFFLKNISETKTKSENIEKPDFQKSEDNDIFEEMSHEINRTLMIQDREEIGEVVKKNNKIQDSIYNFERSLCSYGRIFKFKTGSLQNKIHIYFRYKFDKCRD